MRELVIGDLHFGTKSNSTMWLEAQCNLFRKQFFNIIEESHYDRIVFLGDLFDIRSSLNTQVGIELKKVIREFSDKYAEINPSGYIVFIAGNHDYYSPLEEYAEYDSYKLLFGDEFIKCHPNIRIIDDCPAVYDGSLFLPWYWTENQDHFDELLYNYDFARDIKSIYCHADLGVWPGARIASLKGCPVYAGHIHYIVEDPVANLYNLGAGLSLNFADINEDRFAYVLEDYKIVDRIANTVTPQFRRLMNEQIFDPDPSVFENAYVQLCISKSNFTKAEYVEQIKNLKATYIDSTIRVHLIDDDVTEDTIEVNGDVFNTNIHKYIEDNIPEHLENKYEYVKNKFSEQV